MNKNPSKIYRAKLEEKRNSRVYGWPKYYHQSAQKKSFWQSVRALLF